MNNWEKNIRVVDPYVPGEQPQNTNIIKLNTNENPYPPAPAVMELATNLDADRFKLYPDPTAQKLVNAIAEYHNVKPTMIFPGVGSDDVLSVAFLTFFNSDKPILFPDITYSFYKVWADVYRIPYKCPRLDDDFNIVAKDYYDENGGVIFANPNAPTSIYRDLDFVRDILEHNKDVIVIVDEAYIDFGGDSAISLLEEYENLVIVRTYSKSKSLAGIRIGYAVASERLIKAMNDVKYSINSYTMNMPSIEFGTAAIQCVDYYNEVVRRVVETRDRTIKRIRELGFECPDSSTNFIFARHKSIPGNQIFEDLKAASIYVRHFNQDRIGDYLRISVGTDEEMDALCRYLERYK